MKEGGGRVGREDEERRKGGRKRWRKRMEEGYNSKEGGKEGKVK